MDELARQRRVFRLVAILTGRLLASVEVLSALPEVIPDGPRGERIAVQASRRFKAAQSSLLDGAVAEKLFALAPQVREAWVLRRVLEFNERETAIAMDCSRTVVRNRLETIVDLMSRQDAGVVRQAMLRIGVPQGYQRRHHQRVRARRAFMVMGTLAGVAITLEVLRALLS